MARFFRSYFKGRQEEDSVEEDAAPPAYEAYEDYYEKSGCGNSLCNGCSKPHPSPPCNPCNPCPKPPHKPCEKPPQKPCDPCHKPRESSDSSSSHKSSDSCHDSPRKPCRVQVIQTCPPQTCSLPPPRIQCRYVFDKKCKSNKRDPCDDDRDDDCCDDRWTCDAEAIIWAAIFLFVIFTVLAYATNGTFTIDISALIGKLASAFKWDVTPAY